MKNERWQEIFSKLIRENREDVAPHIEQALKEYIPLFQRIEGDCRKALESTDGWVLYVFQQYFRQCAGYFERKLDSARLNVIKTTEINDPDRGR